MDTFRAGSTLQCHPDLLKPEDWCGELTNFSVRQKGYARHKQKGTSDPPLFMCVGMDIVATDSKLKKIGDFVELPDLPKEIDQKINNVPPYFIVNVMLPRYDPDLNPFSTKERDGPTWCLVIYLLMTPETRNSLKNNIEQAPPAVRLLKRYIEDESIRDRFKVMTNTLNPEDLELGMVLKRLVVDYNMKPVLSRPQHSFHTDDHRFFEIDIDVHIFGIVAVKAFASLRSLVEKMVVDIGFTLEGRDDDELPEVMLAVVHVDNLPLEQIAKPLEQHIKEDARARRMEEEKHARWSKRTTNDS